MLARAGLVAILTSMVALGGCEQAETIRIVDTREAQVEQSCHKVGYCYTMMPGFDGKMESKFKFSQFCPGRQDALVRIDQVLMRYPSKPDETFVRERSHTIKTLSSCR